MLLNGTFNNISVMSWRSVLLVEETEDPEKIRAVISHCQTLSLLLSWVRLAMSGIRTHNFSGDRHWLHS